MSDLTALEIINNVQRELRLPISTTVMEPHAKMLLLFANKVMRDFMLEDTTWDELKVFGDFDTVADTFIYTISSPSGDIDVIRHLQVGSNDPIKKFDDGKFKAYKRSNPTPARPMVYRHYSRDSAAIQIEVCPVPDAVYTVDVEALIKPPRLVNGTDIPLLDSDTIILGCVMLARKDQGEDYSGDLAAFQAKLSLQSGTQGDSNFSDVEPA